MEEGQRLIDPEERKHIYTQYQQIMKEDPPGIFLLWRTKFMAVNERFQGVTPGYSMTKAIRTWWVPEEKQKYTLIMVQGSKVKGL